jgi:hypothetical protein
LSAIFCDSSLFTVILGYYGQFCEITFRRCHTKMAFQMSISHKPSQWAFAIIVAWSLHNLFQKSRKPTIIKGKRKQIEKILKMCPILQRGPRPPAFFTNCHLQFVPWIIQNELHRTVFAIKYERLIVTVTDTVVKTGNVRDKGHGDGLPEDITGQISFNSQKPKNLAFKLI